MNGNKCCVLSTSPIASIKLGGIASSTNQRSLSRNNGKRKTSGKMHSGRKQEKLLLRKHYYFTLKLLR